LTRDCDDLKIPRVQAGDEAGQKHALLEDLEASNRVAFGNGANDVLVRSAEEGLDLLLHPARLIATLRL